MSEQDLHGEPLTADVDAEAEVDERDELASLGEDEELDLETTEADAVEQHTPAGPDTSGDEEYPPH